MKKERMRSVMMSSASVSKIALWIDGREVEATGGRCGEVTDSATGEVVKLVPFGSVDDVNVAVASSLSSWTAWSLTPPLQRARVLMRARDLLDQRKEELAKIITLEHGKTLADAVGSVQRGIEVVEFATGIPHLLKGEHSDNVGGGIDSHTLKQSLGVCAGISPFNFPVMVPMWMVPVALACGNTFVLKPSEKDPSASMLIAKIFQEAGLPNGVLNIVHGDKETVDALLAHPDISAVSFVGSTPVARYVYEKATNSGKRVQALGGAKNHAVVLPDADIDGAADALIGAAYGSAGERCMAISAVVAVGTVGDSLVQRLQDRAEKLLVGPGERDGVDMGPLISRDHLERVTNYISSGVSEGATLVLDGRNVDVPNGGDGFFLGPTLFDHVGLDMTIYRDEIFGPVLVVVRADTYDDAIEVVNQNPYGNGTALFTRSGAAARRFEHDIQVGMVGINVPIPVPMAFFSFGGWKSSLFGDLHVHGAEGVKFYTRTKVVTKRWPSSSEVVDLTMPTIK